MSHSAYKIPISVLVIIHTPQLDVLLMERADRAGFWQSVTGSLDDFNEPLALAAAREVKEETGIDILSSDSSFGSKVEREGERVGQTTGLTQRQYDLRSVVPGNQHSGADHNDPLPLRRFAGSDVSAGQYGEEPHSEVDKVMRMKRNWNEQFILRDWHTSTQYSIYPEWRHRYRPDISINTEHWFSLEIPHIIDITLAPREHVQAIWLPYQQAIDKCFSPSNQAALAKLPQKVLSHS